MRNKILLTFAACLTVFLFYLTCLNHVEPSQIGVAKNVVTRQYWKQGPGWHFTWPWVLVSRVSCSPMRVSVDSAGRGYHAKLVEFVPEQWEEFVRVEGWHYWWWYNRFSVNFGYQDEHRGLKDIVRGYAYCARKYPFIHVIQELGDDQ